MTRAITMLVFLLLLASLALAQDPRYGGPPERNADGSIKRSRAVLREFQRIHPCPSTGKTTGACPRWSVNHAIPLACGGVDAVVNLIWMRNDVKRLHDRYERRIFGANPPIADTAACTFVTPTTTLKDHP